MAAGGDPRRRPRYTLVVRRIVGESRGSLRMNEAIACEKRIKGWTRAKKLALIEEMNPHWEDLSNGWFTQ